MWHEGYVHDTCVLEPRSAVTTAALSGNVARAWSGRTL
jgi:hypothetical protein